MKKTQQSNVPSVTLLPHELTLTPTEAAKRLARAQCPSDEHTVHSALRLDAPKTRGHPLTPEDEQVLAPIWKAARLSPPEFPMSADAWAVYLEAFDRSASRPAWGLWQVLNNPAHLRVSFECRYIDAIEAAARRGEITAREPQTALPVDASAIPMAQRDGWVLSRADLVAFARSVLIEVQEPTTEPSTPRWQQRAAYAEELQSKADRAPTKKTADRFGVSERQVREDRKRQRKT
ncbi:MAG: hypothetical protein ACYCZI_01720 [Metallibacterium scheffleri]